MGRHTVFRQHLTMMSASSFRDAEMLQRGMIVKPKAEVPVTPGWWLTVKKGWEFQHRTLRARGVVAKWFGAYGQACHWLDRTRSSPASPVS
jgi:hypothetical protein